MEVDQRQSQPHGSPKPLIIGMTRIRPSIPVAQEIIRFKAVVIRPTRSSCDGERNAFENSGLEYALGAKAVARGLCREGSLPPGAREAEHHFPIAMSARRATRRPRPGRCDRGRDPISTSVRRLRLANPGAPQQYHRQS